MPAHCYISHRFNGVCNVSTRLGLPQPNGIQQWLMHTVYRYIEHRQERYAPSAHTIPTACARWKLQVWQLCPVLIYTYM